MEDNQHNHEAIVKSVGARMPKDELLCDLGDLFKVFGIRRG